MSDVWNRIQELADMVARGYKNTSLINSEKSTIVPTYKSVNSDYVQFASKYIMPMWIFEGHADNSMIAHDYAASLTHSETIYLIKRIEESQKSKTVYSIEDINPDTLSEHFSSVGNATDIFIPVGLLHEFYNKFKIEDRNYLRLGDKRLHIHHSNNFMPFDKIFIVDGSGITWSQKKVKDMSRSRAKDPEGLKLLTSEEDTLQISTKINDDNSVLFLIRLVASALIDSKKVRMLELSKKVMG